MPILRRTAKGIGHGGVSGTAARGLLVGTFNPHEGSNTSAVVQSMYFAGVVNGSASISCVATVTTASRALNASSMQAISTMTSGSTAVCTASLSMVSTIGASSTTKNGASLSSVAALNVSGRYLASSAVQGIATVAVSSVAVGSAQIMSVATLLASAQVAGPVNGSAAFSCSSTLTVNGHVDAGPSTQPIGGTGFRVPTILEQLHARRDVVAKATSVTAIFDVGREATGKTFKSYLGEPTPHAPIELGPLPAEPEQLPVQAGPVFVPEPAPTAGLDGRATAVDINIVGDVFSPATRAGSSAKAKALTIRSSLGRATARGAKSMTEYEMMMALQLLGIDEADEVILE